MANWTVYMVQQGWAGDIRRNRVVVSGTNTSGTLPANLVGLSHIHAIKPTGHNGDVMDITDTARTCIPAGNVSYSTTEGATAALSLFTVGTSPAAFTGSTAELLVYGV